MIPDDTPEENLEITVLVSKKVFEKALENPALWQHLWRETIFNRFLSASLDLKAYVANGFKPIENADEKRTAKAKIDKLEAALPRLVLPKSKKILHPYN